MTKTKEKNLSELKKIILDSINPEEHSVFLFGSRATQTSKHYSDFDIGILGKKPLGKAYHKIINQIEDFFIPYKIDLVDFYFVKNDFKKEVLKGAIFWNKPKDMNSN
ncbi:MAG: nucleotidyltransferase domain-containing protein [Calditrichaeota bacterium]|nr:MAG: nucleotidyltransferase domain-containing protein [Calditrichota bacterium]